MGSLSVSVPALAEAPERMLLEADAAWWDEYRGLFRDPDSRPVEPPTLDLEGYRLGQRLLFRGELRAVLELPCGRCIEPFEHVFREPVALLREPIQNPESGPGGRPEGGIELDPEDLEMGRYAGDELDFGVILREILLFSWPMQPRCGEDCLGLCPSCGANRNRERCQCRSDDTNRPFAALAQLIERSKVESD